MLWDRETVTCICCAFCTRRRRTRIPRHESKVNAVGAPLQGLDLSTLHELAHHLDPDPSMRPPKRSHRRGLRGSHSDGSSGATIVPWICVNHSIIFTGSSEP
ncbi:hypothetical protein PR202_gb06118 [Eleusine coracana subsp. coracana]|uniref:Uncharacterized protein n=1 Tax=Eleusine coracana subsp. coracana TaxID=191504 RepID=A0AAV5E8P7_ELECO|nr:hypothetical protein PR202_gb06118 [Eleusine coracana subsp. coracana]